ncbi:MAG: hypothetical protein AAF629_09620 [Chloroflexota bacterium]
MIKKILGLLVVLFMASGCSAIMARFGEQEVVIPTPTPTRVVAQITSVPTATNFPKIGTATPAPPTATPIPTKTPLPGNRLFDDETLAEMMSGTIAATGTEALVELVDERANGGERRANITLVSRYNIDESDLLLKLFVLEVGSALRTLRAFREGPIDADVDATFITVNDTSGEEMGTVLAPTEAINDFLEGRASVNDALTRLELTGVFESFLE